MISVRCITTQKRISPRDSSTESRFFCTIRAPFAYANSIGCTKEGFAWT